MKTFCFILRAVITVATGVVLGAAPSMARAQEVTPSSAPTTKNESQDQNLLSLLQRGLFEEEGRRRLDEAATVYETLLTGFEEQKHLAATALFRLAEVRRKQDRREEAIALYQRVVEEFPRAETLVRLSRENLTALGGVAPASTPDAGTADAPSADPEVSEEEAKELQQLRVLAATSPDLLNHVITRPNKLSTYPLIEVCSKGWMRVVRFYLEQGVSPVLSASDGRTPLAAAAYAGNKTLCEFLVAHGAEPKNDPSALLSVVSGGYLKLLDWFLEKGADVNGVARPPSNYDEELSALMVALKMKHETVFQRLLAEHPDVNLATTQGFTALHAAAEAGYEAGVKQLLERGANPNAVYRVRQSGDAIRLNQRQVQLDRPAPNPGDAEDTERRTGEGTTPLSLAVKSSSPECVSLLLAGGAKADEPDEEGHTPLFYAVQMTDATIAQQMTTLLAQAGADASRKDFFERGDKIPPLANVLSRGPQFRGVADVLVAHGADPRQSIKNELKVIHYAYPANYRAEWVRRVRYPEATSEPAIWLSVPQGMWLQKVAERGVATEIAPDLPTVLLRLNGSHACDKPLNWKRLTLWRKEDSEGKLISTEITLTVGATLPPLQWGDIIELETENENVASVSVSSHSGRPDLTIQITLPFEVRALLKMGLSRRITVGRDGEEQPLTLKGNVIVYDPARAEAPLVPLRPLLKALGEWPRRPSGVSISDRDFVTIERAAAAGGGTVEVDLRSDRSETLELLEGDIIRIPALDWQERRQWGVSLVSPGLPIVWSRYLSFDRTSSDYNAFSEPTLFQFLASFYAPIAEYRDSREELVTYLLTTGYVHDRPMLTHPDWSQLCIRRLTESDQEEIITPKLAETLSQITPESDAAFAKQVDIPLQRGDIIELPRRADASGEWTGFEPAMRTLLTKALSVDIVLMSEGTFQTVPVTYLPPKLVPTSLGLLPWVEEAPKWGKVSEMLAGTVMRSVLKEGYHISKVIRRPEASSSLPKASLRGWQMMNNIYLRPNDQIEVVKREGQGSLQAPPAPVQSRQSVPALDQ